MSIFCRITKTCAVCNSTSEQTRITSTNTCGSPDLDLRPPEMERSTMRYWPEVCPYCGYTSYDLEKSTTINRTWLKSEQYLFYEWHLFESALAAKFYHIYMIAKELGNCHDAFAALRSAAWASDDCEDKENAVLCRKLLLPYLEEEISKEPQTAETLMVVKADVLRRAGMFEELIEEYSGKVFSEDLLNEICQFQLAKAKQKDTACYVVADAHKTEG